MLIDFVDGADVGVVKSGTGAGFSFETCKKLASFGNVYWQTGLCRVRTGGYPGQKLKGNEPAKLCVFGL